MKFWKYWPYWLRGGVIALIITVAQIILMSSCDLISSGYSTLGCGLIFTIFGPMFPVFLISEAYGPFSVYIIVTLGIIIWFLIGSLIGFLVGYIKRAHSRGL